MTLLAGKKLIDASREALADISARVFKERSEVTLLIPRDRIAEALRRLRDYEGTAMIQLMDVCGVDYPARAPRFDVAYQLLSLRHNARLTVIVTVDEKKSVPSVVAVHPVAGWFEREVYDLFGIVFAGHPDLRRILTDYDFEGHPLRRDFPLVGFTEVHYDDLQRRVVSGPVHLQQDYRSFDATSSWLGMTDVQKRRGQDD